MIFTLVASERPRRNIRLIVFALLFGFSLSLRAWPGFDWDQWWSVTTWQKLEWRTDQSGRRDLVPPLGDSTGTNHTASVLSLEERRKQTAATIQALLGEPTNLKVPALEVHELGEEKLDGYRRRHIQIRSEPDDWIPAYMLIPEKPAAPRLPAMICLHQTVAQGKEEPCGIRGDPELAFAVELVKRGYVCVAPDVIGFGERIPRGKQPYHGSIVFYRKHTSWSFMGKMIWDVGRVVDYLESLPFVDPHGIGSIGHSHGAYGTLFAAAFEPRIAASVASCGFTTFRSDPNPERWSHSTALIPQLGTYLPDVAAIPFDWQHVLALIAPRPLFVWYATKDSIFPRTENLDGLLKDVRKVYELYGSGNSIAWHAFDGGHRFPREDREAAYRWLEKNLTGQPKTALTPSLSPRERESVSSIIRQPLNSDSSSRGQRVPPLPGGEGRGEGELPSNTLKRVTKSGSAFFPGEVAARARTNARDQAWAAEIRDSLVAAARPWMEMSDDQLWDLMFSHTIKRAWQVWSNGHCPACQKPVPMYEWAADALKQPWKLRCPQCKELFPKNDFLKYYRSGLDKRDEFNPQRADRSLLFNTEHPDASDPKHAFGVDDGEGFVEGTNRWRFIGAYLIFGQWKQEVVDGIRKLAAAYVATGDPVYAHKAGVLLDRVADYYPNFDFGKEGVMYEGAPRSGYVSTWHDACVEVQELALAYDEIFEALSRDAELIKFLGAKAAQHKLENLKSSFRHIQSNIEERIFRDTLRNRPKIESNYPSTDITLLTLRTVLDWPANRAEIMAALDAIISKATAVDGLTGEKGITGYSVIAPRIISELLGRYSRAEPGFLREEVRRHPKLHDMYRFHIDTSCLGQYYPRTGDTGGFAERTPGYVGVPFSSNPGINPSTYTFFWELYRATGDKDFARLIYGANQSSTTGLPHDLLAGHPAAFQADLARVIAESGAEIKLPSVNKTEWGLAILRSGEGTNARAAWLDYDSGGGHGHADGMNIGLFAKGLDLLPDFGYPPVQFGGWSSPRSVWYTRTASHNTVTVDGRDTRPGTGLTRLWFDGQQFRAVRASAPKLIGGKQYERTLVMVDISDRDSYLLDIFRVSGGAEHTRFLHGHFGRATSHGLSLAPAEEPRFGQLMRGLEQDPFPAEAWSVDWIVDDRLKYLPPSSEVHLRQTDLTRGAEAMLGEAWVAVPHFGGTAEAWIPTVITRRRTDQSPLASTFVSVLEPFEHQSNITSIRRLELRDTEGTVRPDGDVGIEIRLADGSKDLFVAKDVEGQPVFNSTPAAAPMVERESGARFEGDLCLVRFDRNNKPRRVVFGNGKSLRVGNMAVHAKDVTASFEIDFEKTPPIIVGLPEAVESIEVGGSRVWPQ